MIDEMSKTRRSDVKASDITDEQVLEALNPEPRWTLLCELSERLEYPEKVVRAKCRTMIRKRRGLDGCYCGCRGDFRRVLPRFDLIPTEQKVALLKYAFLDLDLFPNVR